MIENISIDLYTFYKKIDEICIDNYNYWNIWRAQSTITIMLRMVTIETFL